MALTFKTESSRNQIAMSKFSVILPAAGKSSRFQGTGQKKVFSSLDGRSVWLRTADLFLDRKEVCQVIVVVSADDQESFIDRFGSDLAVLGIDWAVGGKERFDSVANALKKVDSNANYIAVHDAARPCVTPDEISAVFDQAQKTGAAILANPINATIKRSTQNQQVQQTVDRQHLWAAQTPQVFRKDWLVQAYQRWIELAQTATTDQDQHSTIQFTDDSQLIEQAGHLVSIVNGQTTNIKITTLDDLKLAQAILKSRPPKTNSLFHPFAD